MSKPIVVVSTDYEVEEYCLKFDNIYFIKKRSLQDVKYEELSFHEYMAAKVMVEITPSQDKFFYYYKRSPKGIKGMGYRAGLETIRLIAEIVQNGSE